MHRHWEIPATEARALILPKPCKPSFLLTMQTVSLSHGHILAVFFAANSAELLKGAQWYADALQFCAAVSRATGLPVSTVAGVTAALSPNNRWPRNMADAERLCRAFSVGTISDAAAIKVSTFNGNKKKALQILAGDQPLEVLGGLKVRAFYQCILGDNAVCIDGHAYAIWFGGYVPTTKTPKISPKLYASISAAYAQAAQTINSVMGTTYSAAQMQAITWSVWQRIRREVQTPEAGK